MPPSPAPPPAPKLTLNLVNWGDLCWLPIGIGLLSGGGLAVAFCDRFPAVAASLGLLGILLFGFGGLSAGVGLWWLWHALRARTVELGDGILVSRLLRPAVRTDWKNVAEVSFHRSEKARELYQVEAFWIVPIPGIGNLTATTIKTKTRWLVERYVELRRRDKRLIVRISRGPMEELRFSLWYERHLLQQAIRAMGGFVVWDERGFTQISLAGTGIDDSVFVQLRLRLERIRELREIDLAGTKVSVDALQGLDECESLECVTGDAAVVSPEWKLLNQRLKNRRVAFGFLQTQAES
jgi:hypothetical protein